MDGKRRKAFNNFGKGGAGMSVADSQMGLPSYAVKVAGSQGIGSAIEHVRSTKAAAKVKRATAKASRRRNRGNR